MLRVFWATGETMEEVLVVVSLMPHALNLGMWNEHGVNGHGVRVLMTKYEIKSGGHRVINRTYLPSETWTSIWISSCPFLHHQKLQDVSRAHLEPACCAAEGDEIQSF
jgi:hypothetical protein